MPRRRNSEINNARRGFRRANEAPDESNVRKRLRSLRDRSRITGNSSREIDGSSRSPRPGPPPAPTLPAVRVAPSERPEVRPIFGTSYEFVGRVLDTSRSGEKSGNFEWQINTWRIRPELDLQSSWFSCLGSEWQMLLPSRESYEGDNYLILVRRDNGLPVRYWIGVRTSNGGEEEIVSDELDPDDDCAPAFVLPDFEGRWEQLAPTGTLTILVRMTTRPETVATQTDFDCYYPHPLHKPALSSDERGKGTSCVSSDPESMFFDLNKLLNENIFPDVNLKCGNRKIPAHRAILAARSEVFSAMFQSKMSESKTGIVDISDIDVQVLELFLKYVYTGRLCEISNDALPGLYVAGDKYAVSTLKRTCSERMVKILSQKNYLNFLLLADTHSDEEFQNAILDFILNHLQVLKRREWKVFRKENLALANEVLQTVVQRKILY